LSWLVGEYQEGSGYGVSNSAIVQIRKVGEYYVLVGAWDKNYTHREKFGVEPEYREPGTVPDSETNPIENAIFNGVILIRDEISEKLKTKRIKLTKKIVQSGKFPCEHCQKNSENIDDKMVGPILKKLDKYNEELFKYSEKYKKYQKIEEVQNHVSKKDYEALKNYKRFLKKMVDNCRELVSKYYKRLHEIEQVWAPIALENMYEKQKEEGTYGGKFYQCGRCKKISCKAQFIGKQNKLCTDCNKDIIDNTAKKIWSKSVEASEKYEKGRFSQ